ncbi:MAG: hypothetical protein SFU25_11030 [Candidatus Caenarcaniphilales bacterium]|nr:hypothetical protein [Candidatus Caenarcaniphilales bacterium]
MDQPILIVKSSSPAPTTADSQQETLKQIENLLQEEIHQIRDRMDLGEEMILSDYFTDFNLHFQTDKEVVSVVLESEWQEQMEDGGNDSDSNVPDNLLDLEVSKLMRVVKISYSELKEALLERKKIFAWIINQSSEIPMVCGLGSNDYILLPASDIIHSISKFKKHLQID